MQGKAEQPGKLANTAQAEQEQQMVPRGAWQAAERVG